MRSYLPDWFKEVLILPTSRYSTIFHTKYHEKHNVDSEKQFGRKYTALNSNRILRSQILLRLLQYSQNGSLGETTE